MDFQPTDDQMMLADSVERFGREQWPLAERPRLLAAYGRGEHGGHWTSASPVWAIA